MIRMMIFNPTATLVLVHQPELPFARIRKIWVVIELNGIPFVQMPLPFCSSCCLTTRFARSAKH